MKKDYFLGITEEGFHRIVYREWGLSEKNSIPIICVHGLTRNSGDFDKLAAYLEHQGNHIFCPDIAGRGESNWLKNPLNYTYEQYTSDMTSMIAVTGAHQVDWIGTSMGGLIGIVLASLPNSPIRRLVLNDVGPHISTQALARLTNKVGVIPIFKSFAEAKTFFKTYFDEFGIIDETDWDKFTTDTVYEKSPGQIVFKMDPAARITPAKSKLAWQVILHPQKAWEGTLFDVDLWQLWRNVKCPVLVIRGKRSDILVPSTIEKMREIHPNTDVIEIDNAGHAPALLDVKQHAMIHQWLMG